MPRHNPKSAFDPVIFACLVTKIAYGIAVFRLGVDGFEPFLTDIIRGKDLSKLCYFVSGDDVKPPVQIAKLLARVFAGEPGIERDYIFAEIRLFANLGAIYFAIVGQNPKRFGANDELTHFNNLL